MGRPANPFRIAHASEVPPGAGWGPVGLALWARVMDAEALALERSPGDPALFLSATGGAAGPYRVPISRQVGLTHGALGTTPGTTTSDWTP